MKRVASDADAVVFVLRMRRSSNFNDVLNLTFWLWIPLSDDQLEGDIALSWYPTLPISLNIFAALQI